MRLDQTKSTISLVRYIPPQYYAFCNRVNKRWYRAIDNICGRLHRPIKGITPLVLDLIIKDRRVELLESLWRYQRLSLNQWANALMQSARRGSDIIFLEWVFSHPHSGEIRIGDVCLLARILG